MVSTYIPAGNRKPEFATVTEIFVLPTKKVLLGVKTLDVVDFFSHYHAWAVKHSENRKIVPLETCVATNFYMLGHQLFTLASLNYSQ